MPSVFLHRSALDNEENEIGVRCIACSLKDALGRANYAFSISAPVSRMDNERIRELAGYVLKAGREMEDRLTDGYGRGRKK